MTQRCPNCDGQEWFPGMACWDCGWKAVPDAQGHTWSVNYFGKSRHEKLGIGAPVCLQCGVVKRRDGQNGKCKGLVRVGPRAADAADGGGPSAPDATCRKEYEQRTKESQ